MKLTDPRPRLILILLMILALLLSSCRSKHSVLEKKEATVSELQQNDIESSEKVHKDVSVLHIAQRDHFSITPINAHRETKVIYRGDTLTLDNARLDMGREQNTVNEQDRSVATKTSKDESLNQLEMTTTEKDRKRETKSTSWGFNLALILAGIVLICLVYLEVKVRKIL